MPDGQTVCLTTVQAISTGLILVCLWRRNISSSTLRTMSELVESDNFRSSYRCGGELWVEVVDVCSSMDSVRPLSGVLVLSTLTEGIPLGWVASVDD